MLTLFCYAAYFIPLLQDSFYSAGRLDGTFQYSNTYAVFLLAGFLITACRTQWKKLDLFQMGILLSGIVLTGSRSVFVMTAVVLVIVLLRKQIRVGVKVLILAGAAAVVFVLQMVMQADVSRLFKLTLNSSTLNGRIRYWLDALPVILKHPLGLGYLGYYAVVETYLGTNYNSGTVDETVTGIEVTDSSSGSTEITMIEIADSTDDSDTSGNSGSSGTDSSSGNDSSDSGTSDNTNIDDTASSKADSLCVRRGKAYYTSYTIHAGNADTVIYYGRTADEVLVGDWDGNGVDTICVRRGNVYYFKNSISSGTADQVIAYGKASDEVYVGSWK